MKRLSLADLIALKAYLQNNNNGRNIADWNMMVTAVNAELAIRMNYIYFQLES